MREFLPTLFAPYEEASDLRCELRALRPAWDTPQVERLPRAWFPLTLPALDAAYKTALLWSKRFDVYMGVLPRVGSTGCARDIRIGDWLWCDVDGGGGGWEAACDLLADCALPKPQMAVKSGGGLHCYYRLTEPRVLDSQERRESFKETLRRLVLVIGGKSPDPHADPAAAEVARILRVPGTYNLKRQAEPRSVDLVHFDPNLKAYSYDYWRSQLPVLPAPPAPKPFTGTTDAIDGLVRWARQGYPEGNRHRDLVGMKMWLAKNLELPESVVEELVRLKASASFGARRITEEEIRGILRWR
jgi:hypothetical protein